MLRYFAKRLLSALPLFFLTLSLSFVLIKLAPGTPFQQGETNLPPEVMLALSEKYGLDKPLVEQFFFYLGNVVRGDFGTSLTYPDREVREIVWDAFPVSARIGGLSMLVACLVGVPLGIFAALRKNTWWDRIAMASVLFGKSVPSMVVAPLCVTFFAFVLSQWSQGWWATSLLGPVLCLALYDVSGIARLSRASYLEVSGNRYLVTAHAKGLSPFQVTFRHALRETLSPLIVYLGPAFSGILVGTVVVEQVFNLPGLGRYLVQSAVNRDYPLLLAICLLSCFLVLVFNLLSDLLFAWSDPRVRLQ